MPDVQCVRERSWVEDGRWWYSREYADGTRRVACRVEGGPRQEGDMGWSDRTPWANKRQQQAAGETDQREQVAPRLEALLRQHRTGDLDAETLAFACYSIGWGDAAKRPKRFTPDTATAHTPEVQS